MNMKMKVKIGVVICTLLNFVSVAVFSQQYPAVVGDKYVNRQSAAKAKTGKHTVVVNAGSEKLVGLKPGMKVEPSRPADLIFTVKVPAKGVYELHLRRTRERRCTHYRLPCKDPDRRPAPHQAHPVRRLPW